MTAVEQWGGTTVLVVEASGPVVEGRAFRDLVGEAMTEGAELIALPVERLPAAFWDLSTGVAGDLLQVSVVYAVRLALIGEVPEPAASSPAFAALVRESNAGSQHWFLASREALRGRLGGG